MRLRQLHLSGLFWLSAITLLVALIFGGGTHAGFGGDVLIQLVSVALLAAAVAGLVRLRGRIGLEARLAIAFCIALAAVPLIQLVPLPAAVRSLLPGSSWIAESYRLIGRDAPWWPVSLVPEATWISFLSLIAPIALFLSVLQLDYRERRYLVLVFIGFALLSVFLGVMQLAQGVNSPLRFYEITNTTEAVGLFANRNHYAALLYCATLLTASFAISAAGRLQTADRPGAWTRFGSGRVLMLTGVLIVFIALVMAQAMARSRAGIIFTVAGLFGVLGLAMTDRRSRVSGAGAARVVIGAAVVAVVLSLQYTLIRIIERFTDDPIEQTRLIISSKTLDAAKSFLPFGAGTGTFVPVYGLFETPEDVRYFYANHAHNDVAESLLESGALSFALMTAFAIFLARRTYVTWRGPGDEAAGDLDLGLIKAASLALLFLALHSLVDYPLRTSAGATVAALCCGLLLTPLRTTPRSTREESAARTARQANTQVAAQGARPRQARPPHQGRNAAAPDASQQIASQAAASDRAASQGFKRWESEKAWPEAWQSRQPSGQTAPGDSASHGLENATHNAPANSNRARDPAEEE
ncbi:MAG: O-antigen ligase family protein [Hyphomicrobium sp.]|nr:O-antigen ligase family protein [Hyphomicrobium sp.]